MTGMMIAARSLNARPRAAAILLPTGLFAQILALGANGPLLAAAGGVATIAICLAIQILLRPSSAFWSATAWAIALYALILAWISVPVIAPWTMPVRAAQQIVPDLLPLGLCRLLGLLAGLLAAAMIGYHRGLIRVSIDTLLVLAIGQIALALIMRNMDPGHVWGMDKGLLLTRFTGTFLNANASGALFGALSLLAMGRWLGLLRTTSPLDAAPADMLRHLICAIALTLGVGACLITQSRAALILTVILLGAMTATDHEIHRLLRKPVGKIILGLVVTIALLTPLLFAGDIFDRFATLGTDSIDRVTIWSHYLGLALPVGNGGYGLLSFAELNARTMHDPSQAAMFWYINAPHNIILSILLEGGWPYLILWTTLLTGIAYQTVSGRNGRNRQDPLMRAIQASCLLIACSAMVDITLDVPAMALFAMTMLGLNWGRALRIRGQFHARG